MKKQVRISKTSTTSIAVYAVLSEPRLLKALVDELADRRYDIGFSMEKVQPGWQAIDTSSIEAYASGDLSLINNSDAIVLPFDNSFLFTCIKAKAESYSMTWASSLS